MDDSGKEVEVGRAGGMVVRGANVMHGYWHNPKETELSFRNELFRTGDIGYQDAEGYFYILDRLKDMIVSGGENVYPGEVEAIIYQHPAVLEMAGLRYTRSQVGRTRDGVRSPQAGQDSRHE